MKKFFCPGAQDAQDAVEGPYAQSLIGAAKLTSGLWAWTVEYPDLLCPKTGAVEILREGGTVTNFSQGN